MTTITLAEYLFSRLKQLGVDTIHGVPGDYNLSVLDYVEPLGLQWAGNSNELNAGYAADGYARIKGVGALVTTSGVGELSAINAIAGAYAECSPVVHIIGTPPITAQLSKTCLHHTMGDGNFRRFAQMASHVVVAQANLSDSDTAADEVDRVLAMCKQHSRPVYIEFPTDMVKAPIPHSRLDRAIAPPAISGSIKSTVKVAAALILDRIYAAQQPFLLLDGFVARFDSRGEAQELARALGIPTCSTAFGKSVLSEALPNYYGVYAGPTGDPALHSWVQNCDLVLALGPLFCDSNTFGFTTKPDAGLTIALHKDQVDVGGSGGIQSLIGVPMKLLLQTILQRLDPVRVRAAACVSQLPKPVGLPLPTSSLNDGDVLEQQHLWQFLASNLAEGDIVLAETGTSSVGSSTMTLPPQCSYISSPIWLSIGFTLPAAAGAAAALRDLASVGERSRGRTIVFEGDGSFQMTAQSVSDMIRAKLNVIIFILNNKGYTVERWIHGMQATYNDIPTWQYLRTAEYFGAPADGEASYPVVARQASTWGELSRVLQDPNIVAGRGIAIVELLLDESDAPLALQEMAAVAGQKFCT